MDPTITLTIEADDHGSGAISHGDADGDVEDNNDAPAITSQPTPAA